MKHLLRTSISLTFLLVPAAALLAQDETPEVDPRYTWDLTEIYATVESPR